MKIKIITIFCLFLLFLPFTQALTINIGFPLKISELILAFLVFLFLIKIIVQIRFYTPTKVNLLLILFLVWAILSFLINSFWNYDYPLKKFPFRINATGDSFLRVCYITLNFLAFLISVHLLKKEQSVLKYWIYGSIIAGIYAWYVFLSSGLNLPYIKLFGMEKIPQFLNGFVRCGTFKEGNFFGLYLLLSAVISLFLKKNKTAFFLFITIITTFSTISIISSLFFLLFIFRRLFLKKKVFYTALIMFPFVIGGSIYLANTSYFQTYIYSKLNSPSNVLTATNFSKVDRTLTGRIGYFQGLDNPVFGVGPYNYGLHYDQYNDFREYILNNSEWSLNFFPKKNIRRIPNNVYIEVLAEYGFVGFIIFTMFLMKILLISIKNKNDLITGGIIAILISFNAFPSFIMLFIWVFFAIPIALNRQKNF